MLHVALALSSWKLNILPVSTMNACIALWWVPVWAVWPVWAGREIWATEGQGAEEVEGARELWDSDRCFQQFSWFFQPNVESFGIQGCKSFVWFIASNTFTRRTKCLDVFGQRKQYSWNYWPLKCCGQLLCKMVDFIMFYSTCPLNFALMKCHSIGFRKWIQMVWLWKFVISIWLTGPGSCWLSWLASGGFPKETFTFKDSKMLLIQSQGPRLSKAQGMQNDEDVVAKCEMHWNSFNPVTSPVSEDMCRRKVCRMSGKSSYH